MSSTVQQKCLSSEVLNEVIDGVYQLSAIEIDHLHACEGCSLRLQELEKVDSLLKNQWEIPMAQFDQAKIVAQFNSAISESKRRNKLVTMYVGIAASFLFVCYIGYFLYSNSWLYYTPEPVLNLTNPTLAKKATTNSYPYYSSNYQNVVLQSPSRLQLDRLVPMDSDSQYSLVEQLKKTINNSVNVITQIDPKVEHVWLVDNIEIAITQLDSTLEMLNLNNGQSVWKYDHNGNLVAALNLPKGELLQLVKVATEMQWDLLSSQAPQPESIILPVREADKVVYSMQVIKQ